MKIRYVIFTLLVFSLSVRPVSAKASTPPAEPPLLAWQVWPASGERIVPTSEPPANATNASVRVATARGAMASASFAIRSTEDFRKLEIEPTRLSTSDGNKIPPDRLDLRVVKCWYQDGNGWFAASRGPGASVLVPELLLHDDSLVLTDPKTHENLVRTSSAGEAPAYRRIPAVRGGSVTPAASFVAADDAEGLRPVAIARNETRQFYLTIDVPADSAPGVYHGNLDLTADGRKLGRLDLDVRVIPHLLPLAVSRFSGRGDFDGTKVFTGSAPAVITTNTEPFETVAVLPRQALSAGSVAFLASSGIANTVLPPSALAEWKGYFKGDTPRTLWVAPPNAFETAPAGVDGPEAVVRVARDALRTGVEDIRLFLPSRPSGEGLAHDLEAIKAVDDLGVRAWVFADDETYRAAGAFIRSPMRRGYPPVFSGVGRRIIEIGPRDGGASGNDEYSDTRQCDRWHAIGLPYYLFSTLPAGVEDPSVWRRRLGVECFYHGYDGFVLPSLTEETDPWNDWASPEHRSRTFLYPTKTGFVSTLAWEGVRDAVLDVRYLSSVRRLADAVRTAGMDNARIDVEGRKASMWIDQLFVQKAGLDTMRLDAIAWIMRLEAMLGKYGRQESRES